MPRSAHASALLLALLLAPACTRRVVSPAVPVVVTELPSGPDEAGAARAVVTAFIAAEAGGDPSADTLLATGADFVMQGIAVTGRPRLAALAGRGEAAIEEGRTQVAGSVAWAVVTYRFTARAAEPERGRGTFVLERRPAGWRIRHVHTSWVERWD